MPPYPRYKPTSIPWIGQVPQHWEVKKLSRVVDPNRPITYGIVQAGEKLEEGIPYIRPADMTHDRIPGPEQLPKTSPEIAAAYTRSIVRPGDLVVSIGPSYGKVAIVPNGLEGANLTQGTARVAINEHEADTDFMFWMLHSEEAKYFWTTRSVGATFAALSLEGLSGTIVCVPPKAEQTHIARYLDHKTALIDAYLARKRRMLALLKEHRQSLISRAVTKGLDPTVKMKDSGIEWIGEVPEHWEVKKLKFVTPAITVGIVVTPAKYYVDQGVPCLRTLNISSNFIDLENLVYISSESNELLSKSQIHEGDVLVARTGKTGSAVVVPKSLGGANCIDLLIIRKGEQLLSDYLHFFLTSSVAETQIENLSVGAIQAHFNTSTLSELVLPVPSIEEQRELLSKLNEKTILIDDELTRIERSMVRVQEYRQGLISAVVTGKVDVRQVEVPELDRMIGRSGDQLMEYGEPEGVSMAADEESRYNGPEVP